MFFWQRKEVYTGYDILEYTKIKSVLTKGNIRWRTKLVNSSVVNGRTIGSLGETLDYQNQYIIFVKNDDFEQASHLIYKSQTEMR